jgi:hypothetical protein
MRFTFVILLFCCLGADAQMIIKAHPNYVPFASANLLLDDYPNAAAAYSLRKLRTAYTGSAIRVRRSNDNSEQDIGFTASGDLDTASLKTFVGANSGFVTTWYDQGDSARNLSQSTAANQPRIINAGVVEKENNLPSVLFDGSNDRLINDVDNNMFRNISSGAFYSVNRWVTNPTAARLCYIILANAINITKASFGGGFTNSKYSIAGRRDEINAAGILSTAINVDITKIILQTAHYDFQNGDGYIFINSTQEAVNTSFTVNGNSSNNISTRQVMGGFGDGTQSANVRISEIIVFHNISNRTEIETNINSYYAIY